jgi:toxin ParE1/3/4
VTKPVRPTVAAESEIRDYVARYEQERTGLGDRLFSELQDVIALIAEHPSAGSVIPRTRHRVRRFPVRHFPFFLIYRELDDFIEIVALAHTSRRPKYWRPRL